MIFDVDHVTALVLEWQRTRDEDTLTDLLFESTSLIEAIVSSYDYVYRDDLIQEAYLRIQYALPFFKPEISNLHNYFTTVIRNICNTYISKQCKEPDTELDLQFMGYRETITDNDVLTGLISRNRKRFPSIPVNEIDHMTAYIYYEIIDGSTSRRVITGLSLQFGIDKSMAQLLYQSTIIYLRAIHINQSKPSKISESDELSILPDLLEVLGDDVYNRLAIVFSGMSIKLP